jgi:hypothetical protein
MVFLVDKVALALAQIFSECFSYSFFLLVAFTALVGPGLFSVS